MLRFVVGVEELLDLGHVNARFHAVEHGDSALLRRAVEVAFLLGVVLADNDEGQR